MSALSSDAVRAEWLVALRGAGMWAEAAAVCRMMPVTDWLALAEYEFLADDAVSASVSAGRAVELWPPSSSQHRLALLIGAAAAVVAGDQGRWSEVLAQASKVGTGPRVARIVLRAALAVGQSSVADRAAQDYPDALGLTVSAAEAARNEKYVLAVKLVEDAATNTLPGEVEPLHACVMLLRRQGAESALVAMLTFGALHVRLAADRKAIWKQYYRALVPQTRVPRWLPAVGAVIVMLVLAVWMKYAAVLLVIGFRLAWTRWHRYPGLDPKTSQLLNRSRWRGIPMQARLSIWDLIAYIAGIVAGAAVLTPLPISYTPPEQFAAFLAVGIVIPGAFIYARRRAVARRSLKRAAQTEEQARHNLTCVCWGTAGWQGPARRFYVEHHLKRKTAQLTLPPGAASLSCPLTQTAFLDFPTRLITLAVSAYEDEPDNPIGQYL